MFRSATTGGNPAGSRPLRWDVTYTFTDPEMIARCLSHLLTKNLTLYVLTLVLDESTHRHFYSDHGHLRASDSLVPIIFVRGEQNRNEDLAAICEASLVDATPTILDILGLLPSFHAALHDPPDEV